MASELTQEIPTRPKTSFTFKRTSIDTLSKSYVALYSIEQNMGIFCIMFIETNPKGLMI